MADLCSFDNILSIPQLVNVRSWWYKAPRRLLEEEKGMRLRLGEFNFDVKNNLAVKGRSVESLHLSSATSF